MAFLTRPNSTAITPKVILTMMDIPTIAKKIATAMAFQIHTQSKSDWSLIVMRMEFQIIAKPIATRMVYLIHVTSMMEQVKMSMKTVSLTNANVLQTSMQAVTSMWKTCY